MDVSATKAAGLLVGVLLIITGPVVFRALKSDGVDSITAMLVMAAVLSWALAVAQLAKAWDAGATLGGQRDRELRFLVEQGYAGVGAAHGDRLATRNGMAGAGINAAKFVPSNEATPRPDDCFWWCTTCGTTKAGVQS